MLKITVLLPTKYNDGTEVNQDVHDVCLNSLAAICGGYTHDGRVYGKYRMDSGEMVSDICNRVWVVVDSSKLSLLREWAESACRAFCQESLYFEYQQTNVEFIRG